MRSLIAALRDTAKLMTAQRQLWLPFLLVALCEACLIGLIWLAPHPPFSQLLAPPIRYVFGDRVLHYPWHLWFLYHAMKHTHLVASLVVGAFMTGVACAMVRQVHVGRPLSFRAALMEKDVRFGTVLAIVLVTWLLSRAVIVGLRLAVPTSWWLAVATVASAVVFQMAIVYAIPAAVFTGASWWKALFQSLREALRHPFSTFVLVIVPAGAVLAFSVAASPNRVWAWMMARSPELVLGFIVARLAVWTLADAVMTVGVSHVWWTHRAR